MMMMMEHSIVVAILLLSLLSSSRSLLSSRPSTLLLRSPTSPRSTSTLSPLSRSSRSTSSLSSSTSSTSSTVSIDKNDKKRLYKSMLSIAVPSLAACIAEPILTLVDTYCVGKFINPLLATNSLASLSVNGALFNVLAAAAYPLCTATTAMVSSSLGKLQIKGDINDDDIKNSHELKTIFFNGFLISVLIGIPLALLIFVFGESIISLLMNNDSDILVKVEAVKYLKIRALALPTMLLNDVAFGFSLGLQNITAPMYSIVIAFFTNCILDFILIRHCGLGLTGAAIATSISALLGSSIGSAVLLKKYKLLSSPRSLFKIDFEKLMEFFKTSGTMFTGTMLNTLTYSSGASISSFSLTKNSVDVAAYQILMGLWWLLSYFSSPINYIGQALLPKEVASGGGKAKLIISICMRLALIVAVLTSSLMFALPLLLPGLFTNDLLVQQAFKTTIAPVVLSLFIICITTVQDGVFIGMGKVNDYVRAGGISTLSAWIYFTFSISNRLGMKGAWNGMLIFSIVRALWYGFRWKSLGMDLDERK